MHGSLPAKPLCEGIDETLAQLITTKQFSALKEQQRWISVVEELKDKEAYQFTGAVKVEKRAFGNVLVVYVPNAICKVEFENRKPFYLSMIKKKYQDDWVCDIEFSISRSWQRKLVQNRHKTDQTSSEVDLDSVVLTDEEEQSIDEVVRTYITDRLQDSVKKLLITYKKLEKGGMKG